jgi:hypothetical protein
MDQICLVTPVLAGRADAAREFLGRLDGDRRADYERSEQRLGISKEVWFLASGPRNVSLVAYIEAAGFAHSLHAFAASRDAFDVWFKHQLLHVSGVDLNEPGEMTLPELLSSYRESPPPQAISGPIGLSW